MSYDPNSKKAAHYYRQGGTTRKVHYIAGANAPFNFNTPGNMSCTVDTFFAVPLLSGVGGAIDELVAYATGVASSVLRLGVYTNSDDNNLYPASLVVDSGEIDTSTSGNKVVTISATLEPNELYWAVALGGVAAPVIRAALLSSAGFSILGMGITIGTPWSTAFYHSIQVAQAYGALPSTFPSGGTLIESGHPPAIGIHYT